MKGKFEVSLDQMLLDETLVQKKPYAVLVVSTTGLDGTDFNKHSPTRVQLVQYEFDDELKQYSKSIEFDHLVAADIEAVNRAIEEAKDGGYDVFASAEIDVDSYKKQIENPKFSEKVDRDKKVLTQSDFKKEFGFVMQSLIETDTTVITNGYEHTQKYLEKIGCGNELKGMMDGGKVIDQPTLAGEYFKSIGKDDLVKGRMSTLEKVRAYLTPVPNFAKLLDKDPNSKKDFETLSKEEFLMAYSNVKEHQYDAAAEYYEVMNRKATAPERVAIIGDFVKTYGQEKHILEDKTLETLRKNEKERTEFFSDRGKKKYEQASLDEKLKIQEEMGVFDKESIMSGDSDYTRLIKALHGDLGNKGVAIVHIATSGLNNPRGNETGLPLEFHFLAFNIDKENEKISFGEKKEINLRVQLPNNAIVKAEREAKRSGGFDVFKDAGIDINEYKNAPVRNKVNEAIEGKCNWSQEAFVSAVEMTFKKFTPEDYPLIVMGGGKNNDSRAFFQRALRQVCNLPVVDAPYIDFTTAVKEYSCLVSEKKIPENVIFDKEPERMGIRDVANAMGVTLTSTVDKVDVLTKAITVMYNQYLSLEKGLDKKIERDSSEKPEKEQTEVSTIKAEKETVNVSAPKAVAPRETPKESVDDFTEIVEKDAPTQEEINAERNNVKEFKQEESETETEYADNEYEDVMTDEDIDAEEREKFLSDPAGYLESHKKNFVPEPEPPAEKQEEKATIADTATVATGDINLTSVLNAFVEQSRVQAEQSKAQMMLITELTKSVLEQENTYKELLQQQGELLKSVAAMAFASERPTPIRRNPVRREIQEKNLIERLDEIKDNLDALCNNEVPQKAVDYIRDATAAITDGQKILSEIADRGIGKAG